MTENQQKQQDVRDLQIHQNYAKLEVRNYKHKLEAAEESLKEINKDGKEALFLLYVNSSHRSFMKFLKENS